MSLRGRLLIAVVVLLTSGLLIADAATYLALKSFLVNGVDQQLQTAKENAERDRPGGPGPGGGRGGNNRERFPGGITPGLLVGTENQQGDVVWTGSLPGDTDSTRPALPDPLPGTDTGGTAATRGNEGYATPITVAATDGTDMRFRVLVSTNDLTGGLLITALPLEDAERTLRQLVLIEVIVTLAVVAASAGIGLWLVRVGLRPLDDISDTAAHIADGDLSRRVERADDRTEVGRLGTSLNTMLGQIETAFAERQASEQALRSSEERLRRFVADASHELRTPLSAVQAYAELFERGADQHPEDLPRLMRNIHKESARMAVLVDDLLLLTRLDQGRPLDQHPVDLAAIASDAVEAAHAVEPERPVTLVTEDSVEVIGDRVRLRQIADNLVTNVRIHTPPATPVEVHVRAVDGMGVFEVVDHGPGLDDADAAKAFERFYRSDPSRARSDGGTGLGLSIVAAIAHAHHGTASILRTPGGGATVRIEIPLLVS